MGNWDASGTRGSYEAFLSRSMRGDNFDRAMPFDFEMRFTAAGSYSVRTFEDNVVIPVPFELWNIGIATPDDVSDDYRLIPWLGTVEAFGGVSLNPDGYSVEPTDHSASNGDNDPFTPLIYWRQPEDISAGTAGYDAYVASLDLAANPPNSGTYLFDGAEVFARTVLFNWNGGSVADTATFRATVNQLVPEEGTVFRISTTKPNTTSDVFVFTTTAPATFTATKGDVNLDGSVNVADVVALVSIILQIDTPLGEQEYAADVNNDLRLNIADVVGIVNQVLGLGKKTQTTKALTSVEFGLPELVATQDGYVYLPLELNPGEPIAGLQVTLRYDPQALKPQPFNPSGDSWEGIISLEHISEEGQVIYLLYSLQGRLLPALRTIGMRFKVIDENRASEQGITLVEAVLATAAGQAVDIVLGNQETKVTTVPIEYALHQAYPNPFNPVTSINYDLPEAGLATLRVYNLLGQQVRTLVDQHMPAGRHTAKWQGRDDRGRTVPTGVYFIRFSAGGVIHHNKIMLLK